MTEVKRVIAITVNWNRYKDTLECVRSLEEQTLPVENIIVVDNGSQNKEAVFFETYGGLVTCIRSDKNLGFAGGFNLGVRKAMESDPDFILILNNDTIAAPSMVEELVKNAEHSPAVVFAPLIFFHDKPERIWSAGGKISPCILAPINAHNRRKKYKDPVHRTFLSGCCLLLKPEAVDPKGLFDERFFLYFEDLDFSVRVLQAGQKMTMVPEAKLWHKVSSSSGGYRSPKERYWMARSNIIFSKKHTTVFNALCVWGHRVISTGLWTIRLLFSAQWHALREYWRGTIDGLNA